MSASKKDAMTQDVAAQHAEIGASNMNLNPAAKRNKHPDAQWFPNAGLGLFMHFGIASVRGTGDLSWSMRKGAAVRARQCENYGPYAVQCAISPNAYWDQAKDFSADKFNPGKILAAAKRIGVKYAVLTTKHHDGFSLWPSKQGDFNIGVYQPGRDLVKEYVEACRANGIKVGFYYSPPDWRFNRDFMSFNYSESAPALDADWKLTTLPKRSPAEVEAWEEKFRAYIRGQVEELLSNYGKIDVIWFDGSANGAISVERIHELQPGILMNSRGHAGVGDFKTPECSFPKTRAEIDGFWWEYCHVFSDGAWGYLKHETYKPAGWFLAEFVKARAWGGNFLPNVGPDSHGELPEPFYKRVDEIEAWLKTCSESVFDVQPGSWPEKSDVPVTVRGSSWYLHFDFLNEGFATVKGVDKPLSATLLNTGAKVPFSYENGVLKIELDPDLRSNLVEVVKLNFAKVQ